MNVTNEFLANIDALAHREIPEAVMRRAKQSLLDYLAVAAAGARFQKDKLEKYLAFAMPEAGCFTAIGMGKSLALKEAVFLNGLNGHALDFDDGTNSGIIHLGSPIFSLLLPLAQRYDMSLNRLLWAAVIGYETSYTMAVSIQPGHKAMGYHATGTCGVLGAVIAASYMLDFTEEERKNAFAAACVSATGMLKVLDDGSELKPYNVAKTALMALSALQLAKAGFRGHPDSLAGNRGYFRMMTGREDIELKPLLLNGTYAVQKTYTKPYAACRYCHPAIECAINLRRDFGVRPQDVESIRVRTYSLAVSGHDHTEIPGSYSAKMSIPYSVAAALTHGRAGLNEYEPACVTDAETLALAKKVCVESDEAISSAFPAVQTAVMELRTRSGDVHVSQVDFPKGEPENPLTEEEFRSRYEGLTAYAGMDARTAAQIYAMVSGAEDVRIPALMALA